MTGSPDTPRIEVTIAAPADEVWRALRDPALIRRWHGYEYDKNGGLDGEIRVIFVDGVTEDAAGRVLTVSGGDRFSLHPVPGGTVVRITRAPLGADPEWDAYYDDITWGWQVFLHQLRFGLERHGLAERRTHLIDGRLRAPGTPLVAALGLAEVAELPVGARYRAVTPFGETLDGEVYAHLGQLHLLTVAGLGDGLLVVGDTPPASPHRPDGGVLAIITDYGLSAERFAAVRQRWTRWWDAARVPDEQASQQPAAAG